MAAASMADALAPGFKIGQYLTTQLRQQGVLGLAPRAMLA